MLVSRWVMAASAEAWRTGAPRDPTPMTIAGSGEFCQLAACSVGWLNLWQWLSMIGGSCPMSLVCLLAAGISVS